jgi:histidinol-phosphatase
MEYKSYLDFTVNLARQAGKISLDYFQTEITADYKEDKSPVTAADRAVEEFVRGQIENAHPGHAIVGEEFGVDEKDGKSFRWIIDPIDGTKSFMRGIPLYAVLLGLEIEGIVRVGAAYFPALDEMLCAADGEGCWWNGRRAHVSTIARLSEAYICYTTVRDFEKEKYSQFWQLLKKKAYALRGWSDAYGYLAVATGRAEVVIDPVMKIWDCGPFPPIFREAGGYFGSWEGVEGHAHGQALACNSKILPEILSLVHGSLEINK